MTPAEAIAMLDGQLSRHGQDVVFHLVMNGLPDAGRTVRAFVRGFKPHELVGSITQKDRMVTLSPTDFPVEPPEGSRILISGKACRVEAPAGVRLANELVRVNLVARG